MYRDHSQTKNCCGMLTIAVTPYFLSILAIAFCLFLESSKSDLVNLGTNIAIKLSSFMKWIVWLCIILIMFPGKEYLCFSWTVLMYDMNSRTAICYELHIYDMLEIWISNKGVNTDTEPQSGSMNLSVAWVWGVLWWCLSVLTTLLSSLVSPDIEKPNWSRDVGQLSVVWPGGTKSRELSPVISISKQILTGEEPNFYYLSLSLSLSLSPHKNTRTVLVPGGSQLTLACGHQSPALQSQDLIHYYTYYILVYFRAWKAPLMGPFCAWKPTLCL